MTLDLSTWLRYCDEGVPQALEAMFSKVPEVDLLTDLRASYRINTPNMVRTYKRTALNFSRGEKYKQRRHAVRLLLNMNTMLRFGRFNPTMQEVEVNFCNGISNLPEEQYYQYIDETLGRA